MPVKMNVNMFTVVHAGSTGMTMSFPDVCKTPTPAGPVPIPYPNIAQSTDTASGSTTVKVDGNPVMLKGSNFKMSTGDEAGSAQGVMSNKIKGTAEFINYSFDVKFNGKNVPRLLDPMKTNIGASNNTVSPAELQAPIPQLPDMAEECAKQKEKEKDGDKIASERSGMLTEHFDALKQIAAEKNVVLYIRQTSELCEEWIRKKHQPKPHAIFKGNTIKEDPGRLAEVQKWLDEKAEEENKELEYDSVADAGARSNALSEFSPAVNRGQLLAGNARYSTRAKDYIGVVGFNHPQDRVEPLRAIKPFIQDSGEDYEKTWITADYDLYQVLTSKEMCTPVGQDTEPFSALKVEINKTLGWDAIQHGPQAQWVAKKEDVELGAPEGVNFPAKMKDGFDNNNPEETVPIPNRKGMKVFDDNVTVIAPGGTVYLETQEDTFNALKCRDCDK